MDFLNRLFGKDSEKAKTENPPLIWFEHLPPQSTSVAGNKGASLADLTHAGFPVPAGFIVPASAFRTFLAEMGGTKVILQMMGGVDLHTESQLRDASSAVRDFVLSKPMPKLLDEAIARSYEQLGKNVGVAVRSSPVNVDAVPGKNRVQQETFLNIRGGQLGIFLQPPRHLPAGAKRRARGWGNGCRGSADGTRRKKRNNFDDGFGSG
jgi:hypothetical protein